MKKRKHGDDVESHVKKKKKSKKVDRDHITNGANENGVAEEQDDEKNIQANIGAFQKFRISEETIRRLKGL